VYGGEARLGAGEAGGDRGVGGDLEGDGPARDHVDHEDEADDQEVDENVNQNATPSVKRTVIENASRGGAQFTHTEVTEPVSAAGPAPLPRFQSEVKGDD
jgi:hypothetical protein